MLQYLVRSLRFVLVASPVALLVSTALPALAQSQMNGNGELEGVILQVDSPTPNSVITNGIFVDIAGWTSGTRVDAYLDGPAGVGTGIGTAAVDRPRPDVARMTGEPALARSGFDLYWSPFDVTATNHMLYIYSLVDGAWQLQMVPIIGEGNFVEFPDWGRGHDSDSDHELGM
jgi:hypothetical protein